MTQRERNLAIMTGGMFLLVFGYFGWTRYQAAIQSRVLTINTLSQQQRTAQKTKEHYEGATKLLDKWNQQSVPHNPETSMNQYQAWLYEVAAANKITNATVSAKKSGEIKAGGNRLQSQKNDQSKPDHKFSYQFKCSGNFEQLAKLLEMLDRPSRLQEIRSLTIEKDEKTKTFTLEMTIETIGLATTKNQSLPDFNPDPELLAANELAVKSILNRNMFVAYSPPPPPPPPRRDPPPPPPPPPPPEPKYEVAQSTFVTGLIEVDGRPQVWLNIRREDRNLRLFEGETFNIDGLKGRVVKIDLDTQKVDLQLNDKAATITHGNPIYTPAAKRDFRDRRASNN
jgi:hypothetical protein